VAWRGEEGSSARGVGPGACGGAVCGGEQQEVASRPSLGGGGVGARRGGVARGAGLQREGKWVQRVAEVPRGAVGKAGGGLRPSSVAGSAELRRRR
jgi:hypothetical protein